MENLERLIKLEKRKSAPNEKLNDKNRIERRNKPLKLVNKCESSQISNIESYLNRIETNEEVGYIKANYFL